MQAEVERSEHYELNGDIQRLNHYLISVKIFVFREALRWELVSVCRERSPYNWHTAEMCMFRLWNVPLLTVK